MQIDITQEESEECQVARDYIWKQVPKVVTASMNETLTAPVTLPELHTAMKLLPTGKAPGLDGFQVDFFLALWETVGPDILEVYQEAFESGTLHRDLNTGTLCLIPKGGDKTNLRNWRPITLLGSIYKCIAKLLASRIQPMLTQLVRANQTCFMKGRSIIDNVFLAIELMEWALETKQPMVMLLLDFEKAYDRVEWSFLEGTLYKLGFVAIWVKWIKSLYTDSWCSVGVNGQNSSPFKLTRSIRQGCPLAPFFYLFVADCLGYLLEHDSEVKGLKLLANYGEVIDQEYADGTNLYLEGTLQNLNNTKQALGTFSLASGAKINWNKSHAIWISDVQQPFQWGAEVGLRWLLLGETTRYLGFHIGFQVSAEKRFEEVLLTMRKKLAYWCTTHLSLANRILIANQVLLSSLWYVASCWNPHMRSIAKVVSLIRNYIWSGEDGSRLCPAKVAWSSLILPKNCGGLKLIDPELQMKALLVKLFIRGLLPCPAPWRSLLAHRINSIRPKKGGQWPANQHYILYAVRAKGAG
jgi:hypothetical protein